MRVMPEFQNKPNYFHLCTHIHSSSFSSVFPARSLGFTMLSEIFMYVTVYFLSKHRGSHILSSWMVPAGCVFVAGIQPSRT